LCRWTRRALGRSRRRLIILSSRVVALNRRVPRSLSRRPWRLVTLIIRSIARCWSGRRALRCRWLGGLVVWSFGSCSCGRRPIGGCGLIFWLFWSISLGRRVCWFVRFLWWLWRVCCCRLSCRSPRWSCPGAGISWARSRGWRRRCRCRRLCRCCARTR
jgi:hypothetical protein